MVLALLVFLFSLMPKSRATRRHAARGATNRTPALGRGGQPSASPTQADVQAGRNALSSSATRRRAARGVAGRAPALLRGSQPAASPSQVEVQAGRTAPSTGRPLPANPPDLTIASMSLEQLMDAVGTRVRQEMQAQSAANAQLAQVTGPATTSEFPLR